MPPYVVKSPIDFDANRRALVRLVALTTGLPPSQVMMTEGETMNTPRPKAPYVSIQVTAASSKMGFDAVIATADAPDDPTGLHSYIGVRTLGVEFESYGRAHEEAYGIMAALQAGLEYPPAADLLETAGLAAWDIGDVIDISSPLATTYEGRAHLDVTFGMTSVTTLDLGRIDSVPLSGVVATDGQELLTVQDVTISRSN